MAYWALLAKAGLMQGQQAAPGAKADPYGSFSHFMGSTTANAFDPFDIFGQSGNNPVNNFLNPGGATLIKGMTPSNNPLPINPNGSPGGGPPGGGGMPSGMSPGQDAGLMSAYATFLRNIGAPPMRPGGGGGGPGGPNLPAPRRPMNIGPMDGGGQPSNMGGRPGFDPYMSGLAGLSMLQNRQPTMPMPSVTY